MKLGLAEAVWESELSPQTLASAVDRARRSRSVRTRGLALDGAARTADLVAALAAAPGAPEI